MIRVICHCCLVRSSMAKNIESSCPKKAKFTKVKEAKVLRHNRLYHCCVIYRRCCLYMWVLSSSSLIKGLLTNNVLH